MRDCLFELLAVVRHQIEEHRDFVVEEINIRGKKVTC